MSKNLFSKSVANLPGCDQEVKSVIGIFPIIIMEYNILFNVVKRKKNVSAL